MVALLRAAEQPEKRPANHSNRESSARLFTFLFLLRSLFSGCAAPGLRCHSTRLAAHTLSGVCRCLAVPCLVCCLPVVAPLRDRAGSEQWWLIGGADRIARVALDGRELAADELGLRMLVATGAFINADDAPDC